MFVGVRSLSGFGACNADNVSMANFVNVDRETPMLLPVDLREWVPDDDMVHFVIEAVNGMALGTLKVNRRGSGSPQYPPRMMLALLIYCYAHGIFSSRRIERATHRDVCVRYLTGDTHPDHDTISTFRRVNFEAIHEAFIAVLMLAREMGLLKVGTVSIDGTHLRANASKDKNIRYDRAGELESQLREDVQQLMLEAEQNDQQDDEEGDRLPERIARREKLREKINQARAELEARAQRRAEAERETYEEKLEARAKRGGKGRPPKPPKDTPDDDEQINLTDADSKLMRKTKRSSFTQSYNAQAVVDAEGSMLIVGQHLGAGAGDACEMEPALASMPDEVGRPEAALLDAGYVNADAIERVEATGVEVYMAVSREEGHTSRKYDFRPQTATTQRARDVTDPRLVAMKEKLSTEEGKRQYDRRTQTVEPVFGIIKHVMGFRQFLLRGLDKVRGEWSLVCLAYNMKRLHALNQA